MRYPWKYEPHLIPSAPGELFCCNLLKYYAVVSLPRRWYNTLQETQLAGYLSKTVRTIMAKIKFSPFQAEVTFKSVSVQLFK